MDTITAIATPPGIGGIGIVRISGSLVALVARELLSTLPPPRQATYLPFLDEDGTTLDYGIAIFFPEPHSFTGENVLELHGHGGPIIIDLLLQRIIRIPGIRIARPGEFSERAFLNGKLDLTQAEAIADLINANSVQAARFAVNSLKGIFADHINTLIAMLTNLRIYIEAGIDFSDEVIDCISDLKIETNLNEIMNELIQVRSQACQSNQIREGPKVVIAGKPNVGKSSLFNILTDRTKAIVTAIAGTTRDVLHEEIYIDNIPIHIIDTAGLRHHSDAADEVEIIGIKFAWREIKQADHLLLIVDRAISESNFMFSEFITHIPKGISIAVICNKSDLRNEKVGIREISGHTFITLSAKTGEGVDLLREYLKDKCRFTSSIEGSFLAKRRHIDALETALQHITHAQHNKYTIEFLAEELRLAQQALSTITGTFNSEDLLEKIFSNFCIGK